MAAGRERDLKMVKSMTVPDDQPQPPYLKKRVSRTIYAYNPAYGDLK